MRKPSLRPFLYGAVAAVLITACGGGGGGSDTTQFSLAITDAPVDGADSVVVEFTGVELQPSGGGGRLLFELTPARSVDLLTLQGNASEILLNAVEVPAGAYSFLRLAVNAEKGVLDSFITFPGQDPVSLYVPSGSQSGLKLVSGFVVAQGSLADFTVEFDLRKAVNDPQGFPDYRLRPALRMVNNLEVGSISGSVDALLLADEACTNGIDNDTGNAVYVYEGPDVVADDEGSVGAPLASAAVVTDGDSGQSTYTVGFLIGGTYTVALTCQASDDDPTMDDDIVFSATATVVVEAGSDTGHDFVVE